MPLGQIGLGWQSLILVYHHGDEQESQKVVVLTGSEAVSRSVVDAIRVAAATCPSFRQSIPLNRDDESRVEAIEKELIKLGSHVSAEGKCDCHTSRSSVWSQCL